MRLDRTLALALPLLVFWPDERLRWLLFLVVATALIAQSSSTIIRYVLILAVVHAVGMGLTAHPLRMVAFERATYLVAGAVVFNLLQKADARWIGYGIRVCALLLVGHWLVQGMGWDWMFARSPYGQGCQIDSWLYGSFLLHPNYLACFLALSIPLFLDRWKICLIPIVVALVAQKTTTAMVAASAGTVVWFWTTGKVERKWLLWSVLGAVLICALFQLIDPIQNQINRLDVWARLLKYMTPLGHGLGTCIAAPERVNIQSDLLLWIFEMGIPGALLVAVGVVVLLLNIRNDAAWGGVTVAFLVSCVGTIPFRVPALLIVGLVGIAQVTRNQARFYDSQERRQPV